MSNRTEASEVYGWLMDKPIGAYVVVTNQTADHVMLAQGGLLYRDDTWHIITFEPTSPGTGCIFLVATPFKSRLGAGPFVALSNPVGGP